MKKVKRNARTCNEVHHSVLSAVKHRDSAVMLFGSIARGDHTSLSDIDVLELADRRARPNKIGKLNVSVYDEGTLLSMAQCGSLFVLHLREEGKILRDPYGKLRKCLEAYQPVSDYEPYRRALRQTANLLDVSQLDYESRWKAYNELAVFLLRSILYARFAEAGKPIFSLSVVQERIGRKDLTTALRLKGAFGASYYDFLAARNLISEFLPTKVRNPVGTVEALITNMGTENPLMLAFGLRLLGRKNFELSYDLLATPPFGK